MSPQELHEQSGLEALSAWMDGELPPADAERVARLVETDPAWQAVHRDFLAVDEALESMPTPQPAASLTARIVRAATRPRPWVRVIRIAVPLAAAAAIVIAVLAVYNSGEETRPPLSGIDQDIAVILETVDPADWDFVANLTLCGPDVGGFSEVDDIIDAETLTALASLEAEKDM